MMEWTRPSRMGDISVKHQMPYKYWPGSFRNHSVPHRHLQNLLLSFLTCCLKAGPLSKSISFCGLSADPGSMDFPACCPRADPLERAFPSVVCRQILEALPFPLVVYRLIYLLTNRN